MSSDLIPAVDAVERLRRGDSDALADFIERYQHRLYRFLVRLVHDPATAEDLFQQTWIRVMEKVRQFDSHKNFDAWLFTVARNLAIDHMRKRREPNIDVTEEPIAGSAPNPLDRALDSERGTMLAAAVAKLPAIHREVVTLRFEEDMKLEEIAQVAGIPVSTVKSRLHRALAGLRMILERR